MSTSQCRHPARDRPRGGGGEHRGPRADLRVPQGGAMMVEMTLPVGSPYAGARVGDVPFPGNTVLTGIIREGTPHRSSRDDALEPGDELLFVTTSTWRRSSSPSSAPARGTSGTPRTPTTTTRADARSGLAAGTGGRRARPRPAPDPDRRRRGIRGRPRRCVPPGARWRPPGGCARRGPEDARRHPAERGCVADRLAERAPTVLQHDPLRRRLHDAELAVDGVLGRT